MNDLQRLQAFGSTTTPAFGSTDSVLGVLSAPTFQSGGAFGTSTNPGFSASSTPAVGASNTTAFGSSPDPSLGSSTRSFSFGPTTPAFGQSTSLFGSSPLGSTPSTFGVQSSLSGAQSTTPAFGSTGFGQSTFGGQHGGSRAATYSPTAEVDDSTGTQTAERLESISAIPVYKDKSHEELRWEDYQSGYKGVRNPAQYADAAIFGARAAQSNPFGTTATFGQSSTNLFPPNTFSSNSATFGSSTTSGFSSSPFDASLKMIPFRANSSPTTSLFAVPSSIPAFWIPLNICAYGLDSLLLIGSSTFCQKPAFGGFGCTPSQSSPSGSSFQQQQTQPTFESNVFGSSTPFCATRQSVFGATSSPAFRSTSTPVFGATSIPAFGSTTTPAFGSTATAFGSTGSPFGSGGAFGASSTPGFGASSTPAFGASSTPAFGASNTTAFGSFHAPAFGSSSTTPLFSFGLTTPAFGQSASSFGSSPFGSTPSPFGAQSSPLGAQSTTPAFGSMGFGQSTFGGQQGGSRDAVYSPTAEFDWAGVLESISAMPVYKDKSHEELRWEDYQLGYKGLSNPAPYADAAMFGAPAGAAQSNPFGTTATFGQSSTNPFPFNTASNPFFQNWQPLGHQPLLLLASPF